MTLARLVEQFPAHATAVVCEHPSNFVGVHNARVPANALLSHVRAYPAWWGFLMPASLRRQARKRLRDKAVLQIMAAVRQFAPTHLVAVYPTPVMLEATRAVSVQQGLPCLPYFFDNPKPEEAKVWAEVATLAALTEGVQTELQRHVTGEVKLVPHVASPLSGLPSKAEARNVIGKKLGGGFDDGPWIAHTGAVELLQLDGLTDLVRSVQNWPGTAPQVILSSPSPEEAKYALRELGAPAFLHVLNLSPHEVTLLQRAADVLFATVPLSGPALAFGKTCFPTKILDYLAVGTPIVVRGPVDSTLCRQAHEGGYAMLACEAGAQPLQDVLVGVLKDPGLQERLVRKSEATLATYGGDLVAEQLLCALEVAQPPQL